MVVMRLTVRTGTLGRRAGRPANGASDSKGDSLYPCATGGGRMPPVNRSRVGFAALGGVGVLLAAWASYGPYLV